MDHKAVLAMRAALPPDPQMSSDLSVLLPILDPVTEHSCAPLLTLLYTLTLLLSGVSLL